MEIEKYFIKGMICNRCIKVLKNELSALGIEVIDINLGSVQLRYNSKKITWTKIEIILKENEFEILNDKRRILAEQTKKWIIEFIRNTEHSENLSNYLTKKMYKNYQVLSRNFADIFGQTIERFYIKIKIERVKELIEYDELNFSEIAYHLGYQNTSALSRQFKKETGITMNTYQKTNLRKRIPLNEI